MRLERNTSLYPAYGYEHKEAGPFEPVPAELGGGISADVLAFGGQNSTFTIFVAWDDIERAINTFAEAAEPQAIRLQKARRLADAVTDYIAAN